MLNTHELSETADDVRRSAHPNCRGTACRLGVCPPCLIVWGLAVVFCVGKVLLEAFW